MYTLNYVHPVNPLTLQMPKITYIFECPNNACTYAPVFKTRCAERLGKKRME
jgi:hypothetical protein